MKKSKTHDKKELEKLGRLLLSISEMGMADKKRLYKISFIRGVFSGLGGVVGATIVVGLLLLMLSLLGEVPFVGQIAETVQNTLEDR